jgi:hypothetical protein
MNGVEQLCSLGHIHLSGNPLSLLPLPRHPSTQSKRAIDR